MDVRELVCLRTASVWIMPKEAVAAGWLPCPASTIREAVDLYERRNPLVGILLLDNFGKDEDADREIESMLARTNTTMEWIGLVTSDIANQPITRDLLAKYLYDYHTMPIDDARIMASLGHAYGMASLRSLPPFYCNMGATSGHDCMIGDSPAMRKVFRQLSKLAAVDSSVMLMGESGTGKELAPSGRIVVTT